MQLHSKVITKLYKIRSFSYIKHESNKLFNKISRRTAKKRIYYFCTPTHSNLGDQAQLLCWLNLFNIWYPDFEIISVPTKYRQFKTIRTIRENINNDDLIFVHSGYLIFDPHPDLPFILDIIRAFYDKPIVILPQTVNLTGDWYKHIVSKAFNEHPNLTLICRDEVSLEKSKILFPNVKLQLMPDVVTSLIGDKNFVAENLWKRKRKGILFCLRNDLEKFYSDNDINKLKNQFKGIKINSTDTTINVQQWVWEKQRRNLIIKILAKFAKYQLIITDRYHGTIFSQIVNTPVIVVNSADHKLSSGVRWFPQDIFMNNIFYAKDLDEAYCIAQKILRRNGKIVENPPYFKEKYYNKPINNNL